MTPPGSTVYPDPLTVFYGNVSTLFLNDLSAVDTIAGPDNADRAAALSGLTGNARFVEVLYLDELGRVGDTTNANDAGRWVNALNSDGLTAAAVAAGIEQSPEARDHLVKSWYVAFLARQAVGGEEQGWVNALLAGQSRC